ncbi:mitochondrial ubiquitin ligase activator of NFKB 1-like [Pyrus ussuriensis x Pyrus communis]|uniref:RING-type E3 ubiquitin transferase n=1 Tax=Pyrus ussuriensis x Pyrus communis TaxID=2448454 RepID=A0A5N5GD49_9ROSA|nr:mitochondrial ubiquitin ligase activator of NFKB 1-like [Pyrus ussuriensis x Pyrus communis]
MSSPVPDNVFVSQVSRFVLSWDGAVLGVSLACAAVHSVLNFTSTSSSLSKLRDAPAVKVSDLRSILPLDQSDRLVVVRGTVEAKSAVDGTWTSLKSGVLISKETNHRAVVVDSTKTCIVQEWKGLIGWSSDLRAIIWRYWREHESNLVRKVPFVLVDGDQWPIRDMVVVNVEGSSHPIPLTIACHHLQPVNPSPFSFLKALFGTNYPIGVLTVDKILPVGKEISAVGLCSLKNGVSEIKFCNDLPYFLSEMSKDEMVGDLASSTRMLFWTAFVLGSMSIGVLGYAVVRNWNKWKVWRQQRQLQQSSQAADSDAEAQSEEEDVPEGQLCVICLTRRRRSAFIPCGHRVCCHPCSISVERDIAPKCPVCRQEIRTSLRVYD